MNQEKKEDTFKFFLYSSMMMIFQAGKDYTDFRKPGNYSPVIGSVFIGVKKQELLTLN